MAKHILNCELHMLNISCPCYWSVVPLLVFYWSAELNTIHHKGGQAGSNMFSYWQQANLPSTICTMKAARWSPMHVHNVAGESAVYYLHHEGVYFVAKCIHDSECCIQIVISYLLSKFMVDTANLN